MWEVREERNMYKVERAIIMAAGLGNRMHPVTLTTPKPLVRVNGIRMIDTVIAGLHQNGIREIYVVVGFLKERYEYLIDEFGVELIVNPDYAGKNNLYSLKLALPHLANAYVVPCDIWCRSNPFRKRELYSWYMVNDAVDLSLIHI